MIEREFERAWRTEFGNALPYSENDDASMQRAYRMYCIGRRESGRIIEIRHRTIRSVLFAIVKWSSVVAFLSAFMYAAGAPPWWMPVDGKEFRGFVLFLLHIIAMIGGVACWCIEADGRN